MKSINIHFFSPSENSKPKQSKEESAKKVELTGYISGTGKVVLPAKTVAEMGIDFDNTVFRVGMEEGKRKAKSLFLVPASGDTDDSFQFEKAAKSYTLAIPYILQNSKVEYATSKYSFLINLFEYEGTTAFELQLTQEETAPKQPYTGKPRGRKPKNQSTQE